MAKFEIAPGLIFVDRREWVTNHTLPRLGNLVPRDQRTHVFIHHTVTPDADETPNEWENEDKIFRRMRQLQTIRPELGLDVPYNFVAFLFDNDKLMICEGRGEDRSGAHTKGHNTRAIGIAFAGNFEDSPVDSATIGERIGLLSKFLGWLRFDPSHPDYGTFAPMTSLDTFKPDGRAVWLHRDVKATACPGRHLEPHLQAVDFISPR